MALIHLYSGQMLEPSIGKQVFNRKTTAATVLSDT